MGAIVSNPEAIKKVKSDIALVFDTDKPTTSIQANKYVVWRNKLYMTNRAISTSDSFVPGDNIREVTDGVGNDLYSKITTKLGKYVELGLISDFDIGNRTINYVYHYTFPVGADHSPFSSDAGHGFLFVNNSPSYGSQIAFSNSGIKARKLNGDQYGTWVSVVAF